MINLKRAYEEWTTGDVYRVLVDRLWPRGVSKEKAHIDLWLKDIAPSNELRKWFNHDPKKWKAFKEKYLEELKEKQNLIDQIKSLEKRYHTLTLIYGARNEQENEAIVLKELID
jgi:uncharacterized protein YeaO (DUF488 family)